MTATMHISRRTTPHHPHSLRERWELFRLRHSRRAQNAYFGRLHDALPLLDPDRHALDSPALEGAFARLAADHPDAVACVGRAPSPRDLDREQLLVATCDRWFREAHPGPEHRWSSNTIASYQRLLADVRRCFHQDGTR